MSLTRYEDYKDTGIKWLGAVPSHWETTRLKFLLARMGSGGTPDTDNVEFWAQDDDGGTPWVAIGDLSGRAFVNKTTKSLTPLGIASKGLTVWPVGTLLFSMYASLGFTTELAVPAATNQAILALLPSEQVNQRFLSRWLEFLRPHLKEQASSNTQDNLNAEKVRNLLALRPPFQEQIAIATFLDRETAKIDALIAEQEKLIALLGEKRQATISHAVTKGLNPDAPMKDSGVAWLGEVPAHWTLPPLYLRYSSELGKMLDASRITGRHLVPYLRNVDVQWDVINYSELPAMDIEASEYERYTVRNGDLLVCEGGEVGRAAVVQTSGEVIGFQKALHRLRALSCEEYPRYMFYTFAWASKAGAFAGEGQSTIAHLTGEQLRKYRFPRPPLSEQQAIAEFLDIEIVKLTKLTREAECAIYLLKERRSALIAATVTGQVDVRAALPQAAADSLEALAA